MKLKLPKTAAWPICLIFLIGMIFTGNSSILCIDDKGNTEFETFCVSCCDGEKSDCDVVHSVGLNVVSDSGECSDCSDIVINGSLWSKRIQRTDFNQLNKFASQQIINIYLSSLSVGEDYSQIQKPFPAYGQSPPANSIILLSITVFRC